MKTIVAHFNPDVDAVTSVWLVKTFFPGWEEADIAFVAAGETLGGNKVDSDEEIIHVDTGLGRFDHHQDNIRTCAARLVFEYLRESAMPAGRQGKWKVESAMPAGRQGEKKEVHIKWNEEALDRLTKVVVDIDHFGQVDWPDPTSDTYDFGFESILDGWKLLYRSNNARDRDIVEWGMRVLDGMYETFVNKIWAEKELAEKSVEFETPWGKAIGIETVNDDVLPIAQKRGCVVAIRKDPHKGYVRIKGRPGSGADLTKAFNQLKKQDKDATWYLHPSKLMILNGSTKNPKMRATTLSLNEIIEIVKKS